MSQVRQRRPYKPKKNQHPQNSALRHHIHEFHSGTVGVDIDQQQPGSKVVPISITHPFDQSFPHQHLPEVEPRKGFISTQRQGNRIPAARAQGVISEVKIQQPELLSIGPNGHDHRLSPIHTELAPSHVQSSKAWRGFERGYDEPRTSSSLAG